MGRVRVKKRLCRKDSFMGPSKLQQTRIDLGRATDIYGLEHRPYTQQRIAETY